MEQVRCARRNGKGYGCQNWFPIEFRTQHGKPVQILRCPDCRRKGSERQRQDNTKAVAKKWRATPNGRTYTKRANHSDRQRATSSKYEKSKKGKASKKKQNAKPINNLRKRLCKLTKVDYTSTTLRRLTGVTHATVVARLDATFESWMTWDNHGKHRPRAPPKTKWQIGHIIPCAQYDSSLLEDMQNCFNLNNLFAQDAKENLELGTKLPSAQALIRVRDLWPWAWADTLPAGVVWE